MSYELNTTTTPPAPFTAIRFIAQQTTCRGRTSYVYTRTRDTRREFYATVELAQLIDRGGEIVEIADVRDGRGNEIPGIFTLSKTSQFIGVKRGDRIRFRATLEIEPRAQGGGHVAWAIRLLRPHRLPLARPVSVDTTTVEIAEVAA